MTFCLCVSRLSGYQQAHHSCRAFRCAPHAVIMESRVPRFGGSDESDLSDLSGLADRVDGGVQPAMRRVIT